MNRQNFLPDNAVEEVATRSTDDDNEDISKIYKSYFYDRESIRKLNDYCLIYIFLFLPIADKIRLERVCKYWRLISKRSWLKFKNFSFNTNLWYGDKKYFPKKGRSDYSNGIRVPGMRKVFANAGPYVRQVNLTKYDEFLGNDGLRKVAVELADKCSNVTNLQVEFKRKKFNELEEDFATLNEWMKTNSYADKLQELEIFSYAMMDEKNLRSGYKFPYHSWLKVQPPEVVNLRILNLSGNIFVNDYYLTRLGKICRELVEVHLDGCLSISNKGLASIVSLPKIEHISVNSISNITDDIFAAHPAPNLKYLSCIYCRKMVNYGFMALLRTSKKLEFLNVSGCRAISKGLIDAAVKSLMDDDRINGLKIVALDTSVDFDNLKGLPSNFRFCKLSKTFSYKV